MTNLLGTKVCVMNYSNIYGRWSTVHCYEPGVQPSEKVSPPQPTPISLISYSLWIYLQRGSGSQEEWKGKREEREWFWQLFCSPFLFILTAAASDGDCGFLLSPLLLLINFSQGKKLFLSSRLHPPAEAEAHLYIFEVVPRRVSSEPCKTRKKN